MAMMKNLVVITDLMIPASGDGSVIMVPDSLLYQRNIIAVVVILIGGMRIIA
jgi:hypothetical protein